VTSKEGHPDHCSLCKERHDKVVTVYMSATMTRSERQLDALWRTMTPEAQAEATRRLTSPTIGE
jgi:hypothetical protein